MYSNGQGIPQDNAEAVKWLRMAAEQGVAAAQYSLGGAYANGQGVPQDYVQAHKWFNLAASTLRGELHEEDIKQREQVAQQMTPNQIAEAERLAREWKPKKWEELKKGSEAKSR